MKINWRERKQPLALIDVEDLITYKNSYIRIEHNGEVIKEIKLDQKALYSYLEKFSLFRRLLRLDVRCGCLVNNEFFFFKNKSLYCFDLNLCNITEILKLKPKESMPLNITEGTKDYKIIWGEYGNNSNKDPMSIFGINADYKLEKLFTFRKGEVRHIHNIVKTKKSDFIILTGDHGNEAAFYFATKCFDVVRLIANGDQKLRSVQAFFVNNDTFLYASDTVEESNYLYTARLDNWTIKSRAMLCPINGSCIYATELKDGFIFSTTVESYERQKRDILGFLSRKRGKGIKSDEIELIYVNRELECTSVCKMKKDGFPYKLFQYGLVKFAANNKISNTVYMYPVAVKSYDGIMGTIEDIQH